MLPLVMMENTSVGEMEQMSFPFHYRWMSLVRASISAPWIITVTRNSYMILIVCVGGGYRICG